MKLVLTSVIIQPRFVVEEDDGTFSELDPEIEQRIGPMKIKPSEWPSYATEKFPEHMQQLETQIIELSEGES